MAKANESTVLTRLKRDVEDLLDREDQRKHFWDTFWAYVLSVALTGFLLFVLGYICYHTGHSDGYDAAAAEYYQQHYSTNSSTNGQTCTWNGSTWTCH